jgi:hypothetical protein
MAGPPSLQIPSPPGADATPVVVVVIVAVAFVAARATKVFLLRLPFGQPRFRGTGGATSGTSVFFPLPSSLTAKPLREDMAGPSLEEKPRSGNVPSTANAPS